MIKDTRVSRYSPYLGHTPLLPQRRRSNLPFCPTSDAGLRDEGRAAIGTAFESVLTTDTPTSVTSGYPKHIAFQHFQSRCRTEYLHFILSTPFVCLTDAPVLTVRHHERLLGCTSTATRHCSRTSWRPINKGSQISSDHVAFSRQSEDCKPFCLARLLPPPKDA